MSESVSIAQKTAEDTARHEARMVVLQMIKNAASQNNSASVKALAEAYAYLCQKPDQSGRIPAMPIPGDGSYKRPEPTLLPGFGESQ